MSRYIDADMLIHRLKRVHCDICNNHDGQDCIACSVSDEIDDIDNAPTADVQEVRHGRWIRGKNKSAFPAKPSAIWYCSCCGEMIRYNDSMGTYQKKKKKVNEVNPRCRKCGAKMDGGEQE